MSIRTSPLHYQYFYFTHWLTSEQEIFPFYPWTKDYQKHVSYTDVERIYKTKSLVQPYAPHVRIKLSETNLVFYLNQIKTIVQGWKQSLLYILTDNTSILKESKNPTGVTETNSWKGLKCASFPPKVIFKSKNQIFERSNITVGTSYPPPPLHRPPQW